MEVLTPERALVEVIKDIKKNINPSQIISIEAGGSVPLGTYIEKPDLDIFILSGRIKGVIRELQMYFPRGRIKEGELNIWHLPKYMGYPVDIVVLDPDHIKIQTLEHTKYYMEIMDDELRERIKELKRFFKRINCYGAEVGGITGICCTRLAELYPTVDEAIWTVVDNIYDDKFIVEDPTLKGRNLIASLTDHKKFLLVFNSTFKFPDVDLAYFYANYDVVYRINRMMRKGLDKEYQFIAKCVRRAWGELYHRVKHWIPAMTFDTIVVGKAIFLGVKIVPNKIEEEIKIRIERKRLNDKAIRQLKDKYKDAIVTDIDVSYMKAPPFTDLVKEFEKHLYTRLGEIYVDVERS